MQSKLYDKKRRVLIRGFLNAIFTLFFLFLVPNLIFKLSADFFGVGRPLLNFDFVISALILICGYRKFSLLTVFLFSLIEVFTIVGQLFPFLRVSDFVYLLNFIYLSPGSYLLYIFMGAVTVVLNLASFYFFPTSFVYRVSGVFFVNLFLFLYVIGLFHASEGNKYYRLSSAKLVDSILLYQVDARASGFVGAFGLPAKPLQKARYLGALKANVQDGHIKDKVLLIINESWGISKSQEIQTALIAPLRSNPAVKGELSAFEEGELDFVGATVDAELRELCGLSASNFNLKEVSDGFDDCFPWRFRQQGAEAVAFHGAVGTMYDRVFWYPRAGFSEAVFYDSSQWAQRCYSFPGACDHEVLGKVLDVLNGADQVFVYWLTLNTHAIYDRRDLFYNGFDCERFEVGAETQTCRNLELQAQFFHNLANAVEDGRLSGTRVVVVGDHAPPIFNSDEKDRSFFSHKVPWISFTVQ